MVRVLVNWSFVSTAFLESKDVSDSRKGFTIQKEYSTMYIPIFGDRPKLHPTEVLLIC